MASSAPSHRPVALCILDGWGLSRHQTGNAIAGARTPNFDRLWARGPAATLVTHGESVGLPDGCIGNSEVGHLHIGAGRTILMDMQKINAAIADESFFSHPRLKEFADTVRAHGGRAHVAGLASDVGVHGLLNHLVAATHALNDFGVSCDLHIFTDGRDSAPGQAPDNLDWLEHRLPVGVQVRTVCGRYFAMDRDRRFDRVEKVWQAMVKGCGRTAQDAAAAVNQAYHLGETDEFILPSIMQGYTGMHDGDGLFFVNFRSDRMRQLVAAIAGPEFDAFDISMRPKLSATLTMVPYFPTPLPWMHSLFVREEVKNGLGAWVAAHGKTQYRLAETEKYPHVTYFLNGGKEAAEPGEVRYMATSPKVATYDLAPEMAADEIAEKFCEAVPNFDLIVVNFANPDMVGHTGNLSAAIQACEVVDHALGQIESAIRAHQGVMILAADHGNCENMIDPETGHVHTAHTLNPVPVILVGFDEPAGLRAGTLADLAPTLLDLMNIQPPREMTGSSLLIRSCA